MRILRYTLLTDGTSDQVLIPLLTWLLRQHGVGCAIEAEWADPRRFPRLPQNLTERIQFSMTYFPCDLLFVHRDSEREPKEKRFAEIEKAKQRLPVSDATPVVCVVPVRMQEAWLLFDEQAIRKAARNRHGKEPLDMPDMKMIEKMPDPKGKLHELLRKACDLNERRKREFDVGSASKRVLYDELDFSPLRVLPAFQRLEEDIRKMVEEQGWDKWK